MLASKSKPIKQHLARARAVLNRGDLDRGIDELITAVETVQQTRLLGQERFEIQAQLRELLKQLNSHQTVQALLASSKVTSPFSTYKPGKEQQVLLGLQILAKYLERIKVKEEEGREVRSANTLEKYMRSADNYILKKDYVRARSFLRKAAEAFGHKSGVSSQAGEKLIEMGYPKDAAMILQKALERFPDDSSLYRLLVQAFSASAQYKAAEGVYLAAIRKFGKHPKSYYGLAKLYLEWRKPELAFDYLQESLKLDPNYKEAKVLLAQVEKKIFISGPGI